MSNCIASKIINLRTLNKWWPVNRNEDHEFAFDFILSHKNLICGHIKLKVKSNNSANQIVLKPLEGLLLNVNKDPLLPVSSNRVTKENILE